MGSLKNIEVIALNSKEGKLFALLSFQNLENVDDINSGFDTVEVPVNIRPIKLSSRGNRLVDQSDDLFPDVFSLNEKIETPTTKIEEGRNGINSPNNISDNG